MSARQHKVIRLPSARTIQRAIRLYLRYAYSTSLPAAVAERVPPENFDPQEWLMGPHVERDPPNAPLEGVRSFAMRLGNDQYPHMKLRLSRPPCEKAFLFTVDCHDTFLSAPIGSPDYEPLEALKRHNAIVAEAIRLAWEQARLRTERVYLRGKITQAKTDQPKAARPTKARRTAKPQRPAKRRSRRPRQGGSDALDSKAR